MLCTVTMDSCTIGERLLELRRELGWRGLHVDQVFHASYDPQAVRDEVFALLADEDFRVDATILEKAFHQAVDEVVLQVAPCSSYRVASWPMVSDPCLQVADSCTWAIQRKWGRVSDRQRAGTRRHGRALQRWPARHPAGLAVLAY